MIRQALARRHRSPNDLSAFGVLHVRFDGRSCDVPLSDLDVGNLSSDDQVKCRLATYLDVSPTELSDYKVDRHETGNMTVRPEAIFG